jgi:hypothetical protein
VRLPRPPHLAATALLAAGLLPFARAGLLVNDELTTLANARRLLAGAWPYRDYFDPLPPVSTLLAAAALAVGGPSVLAAHALAAAWVGLAALLLVWCARRLGAGVGLAWLGAFLLVFCLYAVLPCWNHHWAVLPFDLAAFAAALAGLARPGAGPWLGAGVALGLAGLTVQTDGVALGLALVAGIGLDAWQRRAGVGEAARRLGWLAAGALAMVGGTALVLALGGALSQAVADVVVWPTVQYRQPGGINDLVYGADLPDALLPITPFPGWQVRAYRVLASFLLVPVAALAALAWLAGRLRTRAGWAAHQAGLATLAVWAVLALVTLLRTGRSDLMHAAHYGVPSLLLVVVGAAFLPRVVPGAGARVLAWLPAAGLAAYLAAGVLGLANAVAKAPERWLARDPERAVTAGPALAYLRDHLRPGDRIAAMPYGGYYYFYAAPPATRWSLMLPPGLGYGAPGEFQAYWAEIAANRPRFIVIAPWGWKPFDLAVADYAAHLPPGYRHVGSFGSPQYAGVFPAEIYEDERAAGR